MNINSRPGSSSQSQTCCVYQAYKTLVQQGFIVLSVIYTLVDLKINVLQDTLIKSSVSKYNNLL